jgi:hypothetical protein
MNGQRVAAINDRNPLYTLHLHAQTYTYVNAYADHTHTHTQTGILTVQLFNLNWEETAATAREDELQQHMLSPTANTSVPNRCLRSLRHERAFECREFVFIDISEKRLNGRIRIYLIYLIYLNF